MQLNSLQISNPLTKKFKGEVFIVDYNFKRDLTQKTFSTLTVHDTNNIIEIFDVFYISHFYGDFQPISGIVVNTQNITNNKKKKQIQVVFGFDVWTNEIYMPKNSLNGVNLSENNLTQYNVSINTKDSVITSNNFLNFDTLCRQAMRKSPKKESFSSLWDIKITDIGEKEFIVNAEDCRLANLKSQFASDTFNKLTLYNQDDKSKTIIGYLNDGVYSKTPDPNIVYIPKYEVVQADNFTESYLKDKLKTQSYNNKFEFDINFSESLEAFNFDNTFLGRRVTLFFDEIGKIESFISGYSFKDRNTLHVVMGLTRTRLTELLKKEA